MRNTIIVTVLLFIGVIIASIFYFRDISNEQHDTIKPLKYLPENTFVISSIKNDEITDNIFKDFDLFEALLGKKEMQLIEKHKLQLLRHQAIYEFIENQDIYISLHPDKNSLELLFTIPTNSEITQNDFSRIFEEINSSYKTSISDTLGSKIISLNFGENDSTLYSTYFDHIIFASSSKDLLLAVLDKSKPKLSEYQIDYFIQNNSRNTPFSVYFPHQNYASIIKHFQRQQSGIFSNQFAGLSGQSAWNINFKQDALILTGESELSNTSKNYIAVFRNQNKETQKLYNYFPSNTSMFMEYSISDYQQFTQDLSEYFQANEETKRIKTALESLSDSSSSSSNLISSLDHNFALVEQANGTHLGFIGLADTTLWKKSANNLLESSGDEIYRFKTSNIPYALYGEPFKNFTRPYITRLGNILVIANSSKLLTTYLDHINHKNLLTATLGFKNFEKIQGNEASVTFFVHNKNSFYKISNTLPSDIQKAFRDKENYGFQDFYSWSVQLSGNRGNFSSQIYALYKSKNTLGGAAEWSYQFGDKAITAPYVFDESDSSQMILIQELNHTLHSISPKGTKNWTAVLSGRVVGEIKQLSDRSIILVTDRNRLYRFNTKGESLIGLSTDIKDEPVAAPLLANIDNQEALIIPTKKSLYAFDLNGNKIEGWSSPEFQGNILGEVLPMGNDFVVGTSFGRIYILNNQGSLKKEIDIPGDVEFKTPIQINDLGNATYEILAYDNTSTLYRISPEKILSEIKIENTSDKYMGAFGNINGSSSLEFIRIEGNQLQAFEPNSYKPIFEHFFTKNIEDKPQFLKSTKSNQNFIGIASRATNLLYLFNENGGLEDGFPVEGQPLFYYGKINYNSDIYLLCMRRDKKLYAFRHQK